MNRTIAAMRKAERQARKLFGKLSFDERSEVRFGLEIVKYRLSQNNGASERLETVNRLLTHLDTF
jgi:hypothetical protein